MTFPLRNLEDYQPVTGLQMLRLDELAMSEGFSVLQMMENASGALSRLSLELSNPSTVLVLAGSGGNGGGGMATARRLANLGIQTALCSTRPKEQLSPIPRLQFELAEKSGVQILQGSNSVQDAKPDLIIDALTGYSIQGELEGAARELAEFANHSESVVISLDLPSGLKADSAESLFQVAALATLTVAAVKTSLVTGNRGRLFLADIGIPLSFYQRLGISKAAPTDLLSELN